MTMLLARLLKLLVASALLFGGLVAGTRSAVAQGTADLFPEPLASAEFEAALDRIGVTDPETRIEAMKAFEAHVAAFVELRKGAIDAYLAERPGVGAAPTREEIAARVERRRQLLRRIAASEGELFDRVQTLVADDARLAAASERLRAERRRLWQSATPSLFGGARRPVELADVLREALKNAEPFDREALDAELAANEQQATTLLRRIAELSIEEPIRVADARAGQPAERPQGEEEALARFEAQRRLVAEARAEELDARLRLRRQLREGAARLERLVPAQHAATVHERFVAAAYPQLAGARDPIPPLAEDALAAVGDDAEKAASIRSIVADHATRRRELDRRLMAALDEEARGEGAIGFAFRLAFDGEDEERAPTESERLLTARRELDDASRTALAAISPAIADALERRAERREDEGVPSIAIAAEGVDLGGSSIVVFSDDGGGGGVVSVMATNFDAPLDFSAAAGTPKAMSRADIDALRTRFGLSEGEATVLELLFEEYVAGWSAIDGSDVAELRSLPGGIGAPPPDAATLARRFALRRQILERLLVLDGEFFDSLGAALSERIGAEDLERLRRERTRDALRATTRGAGPGIGPIMIAGGGGASESVDLARVVRETALAPTTRAALAAGIDEWDRAATAALRDRFETMIVGQQRLAELDLAIMAKTKAEEGPDGSRRFTREVRISNDMPEFARMEETRRTMEAADRRVRDLNDAAMRGILAAMNDAGERELLEDAWDRAVHPGAFRDPKSAAPTIARAAALQGLDAQQADAIAALDREYRAENRRIAKELIASQRSDAATPGEGIDIRALQRQQDVAGRIRLERNALNERTQRRLKEILGEERYASIADAARGG